VPIVSAPVRTDYSMTASPGKPVPVAVRASGCVIEDADGNRYLDACGGAMVMLLGHSHPRIVEALRRQAEQIAFTYRFSFGNEPMLELADRIARIAPGDLEWCFFNSSGSEANESALHLAVLYWEQLGRAGKVEFLSRVTSYHGSTMGALSLSGSRWRAPFELLLQKYAVVPNSDTAEEGAAALIATHNFGRDCAALRYLLPLGLPYIGVIGARRRRDEILVDVIDSGAAMNSQLFAPAGLHLAAESPEEIALSIVAEIQCVFARVTAVHLRERKAPIHDVAAARCSTSAQ